MTLASRVASRNLTLLSRALCGRAVPVLRVNRISPRHSFLLTSVRTMGSGSSAERKAMPTPEPPKFLTVHELLLDSINKVPDDRIAFIETGRANVTYGEFRTEIARLTNFLVKRNITDQIVGVVSDNRWEIACILLAATSAGGAMSGMNQLFTVEQLENRLRISGANIVFTTPDYIDKMREVQTRVPHLQTLVIIGEVADRRPSELLWSEVMRSGSDTTPPRDIPIKPDNIALLLYSSGTTSEPKGVMITHKGLTHMLTLLQANKAYWKKYWVRQHMPFLPEFIRNYILEASKTRPREQVVFTPMWAAFGIGPVLIGLMDWETTVLLKEFNAKEICDYGRKFKITSITAARTDLPLLLEQGDPSLLSHLLVVYSGGAAVSAKTRNAVQQKFLRGGLFRPRGYVLQGYGQTEVTMASHMPVIDTLGKPESAGRAMPWIKMKIVDEKGNHVPPGTDGEICLSGPTSMAGYIGNEEATARTIRDGWVHTGDYGHEDADGDLYLVDRIADLLKIQGVTVAPSVIEKIIITHPLIDDVGVIGPDEAPRAYVTLTKPEDAQALTEQVILDLFKRDEAHLRPTGGIFVLRGPMPRFNGKLLRTKLRQKIEATRLT